MQKQDHILLELFQNNVNCKKAVSKVWYKESNLFLISLDGTKEPDEEQIPRPSSNVF